MVDRDPAGKLTDNLKLRLSHGSVGVVAGPKPKCLEGVVAQEKRC